MTHTMGVTRRNLRRKTSASVSQIDRAKSVNPSGIVYDYDQIRAGQYRSVCKGAIVEWLLLALHSRSREDGYCYYRRLHLQ